MIMRNENSNLIRLEIVNELFEENSNLKILILSKEGNIIEFNRGFQLFYGWNPESIIGMSYFDMDDSQLIPISKNNILKAINKDQDLFFERKKGVNNKKVWVKWEVVHLTQTNSIMLIGISHGEYRRSQNDALLLNNIIDIVPHYIFWKDENSVFIGCNQAFSEIAGLNSPDEIIGKKDSDLPWSYGETGLYVKDDYEVIKTGEAKINYEEVQTRENGEKTVGLVSKIPLKNEQGEVFGLLGIYTDITNIKKKEIELKEARVKAEALSQAKSEFIQNISHDLRTPLTGLVTVSESYADTFSDGDVLKDAFLMMRDSSNQLHNFLEKIIESVKLENYTELPKEFTRFSIEETINRVLNLFKPAMLSKSLSHVVQRTEQSIETKLIGYPDLIERILMNLIGNAVKFTDSGSITVSYGLVDIAIDQQATHNLVLIVNDTGKGIEPSKHQAIFERLTRLSPSYKGIYEGYGLGLYITRELISLMNGHIIVESDGIAGRGSTFTCHIPIKLSDEQLVSSASTPVEVRRVKQEKKSGYRILLADDSEVARYGAKLTLKNTVPHCTITEAETVEDIIQCIESNQYDLIITDLKFSDGGGKKMAKEIRGLETSKNQTTPIVALTGDTSKLTEQECAASGIDQVLHKPLTLDVVNKMMNNIFNDK